MATHRNREYEQAMENNTEVGKKSGGSQRHGDARTGGVQGHPDFSAPEEAKSPPHEESYLGSQQKAEERRKREENLLGKR